MKLRQNSDKTTDGKVEIEANGEVIAKDTEVEGEETAPEINKNGFNLSLAEKTHLQPNKSFQPQLPVDNLITSDKISDLGQVGGKPSQSGLKVIIFGLV